MSPRAATASDVRSTPPSRVSEKTWFSWSVVVAIVGGAWYLGGWASRIDERLQQLVVVVTAQGTKLVTQGEELRSLHTLTTGASARLDRVERLLDEKR